MLNAPLPANPVPVLALDCDGVLLDWQAGFCRFVTKTRRVRPAIAPAECADWAMRDLYPDLSPVQLADAIRAFAISPEYRQLMPLPGAVAGLARLRASLPKTKVWAVTASGTDARTVAFRRSNLAALSMLRPDWLSRTFRAAEWAARSANGWIISGFTVLVLQRRLTLHGAHQNHNFLQLVRYLDLRMPERQHAKCGRTNPDSKMLAENSSVRLVAMSWR
jgi:hypothetical protein